MYTCENCNNDVTSVFARVFSTNEGRILACLECSDKQKIGRNMVARDYARKGKPYRPSGYGLSLGSEDLVDF